LGKVREFIVKCFFIGKQKVILFPKFRENGWITAASAFRQLSLVKIILGCSKLGVSMRADINCSYLLSVHMNAVNKNTIRKYRCE
jgi:hypothetical protein